ncbi:MAG: RtcB family protein [Aggregatilineales bacterium]
MDDQSAPRSEALPFQVWGREHIDQSAFDQMEAAMRLPVAVAGALMPDAHAGYGLPIGGVLATAGVVIPYAVGVDIACRMRMTVFAEQPQVIDQRGGQFKKALVEHTRFGAGAAWERQRRAEHEVMDDPDWEAMPLLRSLKDTAYEQLGTSGAGNHFVEWGVLRLQRDDAELGLAAGSYLALLSHSGSRGVGHRIANHFSELAMSQHRELSRELRYLSWLSLSSAEGMKYWLAMHLAGRYASANHQVIHQRLARALDLEARAVIENHHNFAWRETLPAPDGFANREREVIVHRKGATPAGKGVLGIIPGSMADAGYVVRGRGVVEALRSAAHGAGRMLSRKAAKESITRTARDQYLKERNVVLIGGGLDEAPQAYKPIDAVIAAQAELVDVIGRFEPRIVRMAQE